LQEEVPFALRAHALRSISKRLSAWRRFLFLQTLRDRERVGERESRPRNDDGGNPFYLRMTSQGRPPRCRERKRETALQVLAAVSLVALLPNRRAHSMIDFAFNVNSCREKSVGHPLM